MTTSALSYDSVKEFLPSERLTKSESGELSQYHILSGVNLGPVSHNSRENLYRDPLQAVEHRNLSFILVSSRVVYMYITIAWPWPRRRTTKSHLCFPPFSFCSHARRLSHYAPLQTRQPCRWNRESPSRSVSTLPVLVSVYAEPPLPSLASHSPTHRIRSRIFRPPDYSCAHSRLGNAASFYYILFSSNSRRGLRHLI